MRNASHSFAVFAPWPRLLSRVVLQGDGGIKPDFDARSFIVVLDKTEQSPDYQLPSRYPLPERKNGVSFIAPDIESRMEIILVYSDFAIKDIS